MQPTAAGQGGNAIVAAPSALDPRDLRSAAQGGDGIYTAAEIAAERKCEEAQTAAVTILHGVKDRNEQVRGDLFYRSEVARHNKKLGPSVKARYDAWRLGAWAVVVRYGPRILASRRRERTLHNVSCTRPRASRQPHRAARARRSASSSSSTSGGGDGDGDGPGPEPQQQTHAELTGRASRPHAGVERRERGIAPPIQFSTPAVGGGCPSTSSTIPGRSLPGRRPRDLGALKASSPASAPTDRGSLILHSVTSAEEVQRCLPSV